MAYKEFILNEHVIKIYKRRSNRSLRLSVAADGQIRVSIPTWVAYKTGLDFVRSKEAWIMTQQRPQALLKDGQAIGKAHHLRFEMKSNSTKPASRVSNTEIVVSYPPTLTEQDDSVQKVVRNACIRALRQQAEQLLPQRLRSLALQHGYQYESVEVRQLKSRWGSCDQHQRIVLNLFLMQLPWHLIDYVLLHELNHTEILQHGPRFWAALEQKLPNAKQLRKEMKLYQAALNIRPSLG